jgi:hypothetical protein
MTGKEEVVSVKEATREVETAVTRVALLHLSFSKILVEELGEEKGKELVIRSILEYGKRVGERVKRGLPDLPKYGVHGGFKDGRVYNCVLARTFREYGEQRLGCLYCYVDPAKRMAIDPMRKVIHTACAACGDDFCTFKEVSTTEKERVDFVKKDKDWKRVDPRLIE